MHTFNNHLLWFFNDTEISATFWHVNENLYGIPHRFTLVKWLVVYVWSYHKLCISHDSIVVIVGFEQICEMLCATVTRTIRNRYVRMANKNIYIYENHMHAIWWNAFKFHCLTNDATEHNANFRIVTFHGQYFVW